MADSASHGYCLHAPCANSCTTAPVCLLQYNPRFEEDFVSGKDYDPDRWGGRLDWSITQILGRVCCLGSLP